MEKVAIGIALYLAYVLIGYITSKVIFLLPPGLGGLSSYNDSMKHGWSFILLITTVWPMGHLIVLASMIFGGF